MRTSYPMALVRDARTGEVLSFARGGIVEVPASGPVEVTRVRRSPERAGASSRGRVAGFRVQVFREDAGMRGHGAQRRCPLGPSLSDCLDFGLLTALMQKSASHEGGALVYRLEALMTQPPSLEPYVLPNDGGHQAVVECGSCTHHHWNSTSYRAMAHPARSGCAYGAEGDRTPDLCNANAALSQLSYSPS